MLKLMKYEIKSVWWLYVTSGALVLAMAGISRLLNLFLTDDPDTMVWRILPYSVSVGLAVFFIIASFVLANVIPAVRFYQTVLKDQGYLTFTLPVGRSSVYFAKLLTGALGLLFTLVVAAGGVFIAFVGTKTADVVEVIAEIFSVIDFGEVVTGGQIVLFVVTVVLALLQYLFGTNAVLFCSMCIGQLASGNKLLYSILSYVGISTAASAISSFFSLISQAIFIDGLDENAAVWALDLTSFLQALPPVLITVGCVITANIILKKHLNLE